MRLRPVIVWAAAAALAAPACSHDDALILDVRGGSAGETVELVFAGPECVHNNGDLCNNGNGVAWTAAGPQVAGTIYTLARTDVVTGTVGPNGSVRFEIERPSTIGTITRIVAVGEDGSGNAVQIGLFASADGTVPDDGTEIVVQLEDVAGPPSATAQQFPTAIAWRQPSTASCLGIQLDSTSAEFYTLDHDHDCDGISGSAECDDYWFKFSGPTDGACLTAIGPTSAQSCALGTPTCTDGSSSPGCAADVAPRTCFPLAYCSQCPGQNADPLDTSCLEDVGQFTGSGSAWTGSSSAALPVDIYIECDIGPADGCPAVTPTPLTFVASVVSPIAGTSCSLSFDTTVPGAGSSGSGSGSGSGTFTEGNATFAWTSTFCEDPVILTMMVSGSGSDWDTTDPDIAYADYAVTFNTPNPPLVSHVIVPVRFASSATMCEADCKVVAAGNASSDYGACETQ